MLRCISLLILLPLCVLGQADVLLSTPSKNFVFPTHQPVWEQPHAPTVPPTKSSASAETATTPEQYVTGEATSQPALDSSDSTETIWQPKSSTVEPTTQQTPQPTNSTVAPSTPQPTNSTVAPSTPQPTNSTVAPSTPQPTNSTVAPSTPQPTTPAPTTPPLPKVGDYVVRYEWNTSVCLMARMGLQFSFRMGESFQTINLDPNVTLTGGTCGNNGSNSALMLISNKIAVQFIFTNQTNKFFLSALNLTAEAESGPPFTAMNSNLSLWEASLGSSYMCKKEQSFNITDALILNTFELQVQPFGIMNGQFSTAHECSVDDASLLIPIIVGAALAVLILIVVIAYVIGRRKTYVGYQTL